MHSFRLLQLATCCLALSSLVLGGPDEPCACTDNPPKGGLPCEEQRALGKCALKSMEKGNYCSISCGFCTCGEDKENSSAKSNEDCDACTDIPPAGDYTCEEQAALGKCVRGWMEGFCLKSCKKCSCNDLPTLAAPTVDLLDDAKAANVTSAESFEIPKLVNGTTAQPSQLSVETPKVASDTSEPELVVEDPTLKTGENVPQPSTEATQLQENGTDANPIAVDEDEGALLLKNVTEMVLTPAEEATALQNNATDNGLIPVGGGNEAQLQNKTVSVVPIATEEDAGEVLDVDELDDLEEEKDYLATEDKIANSTSTESAVVSTPPGLIETDKAMEPDMETSINSPLQNTGSANTTSSDNLGTIIDTNTTSGELLVPNSQNMTAEEEASFISSRPGCQTIMQLISTDERLTRLSEVVRTAGIELALEDSAIDITFFAPTNSAFQVLGDLLGEDAAEILARPGVLKLILSNHSSRPRRSINEILNSQSFTTLAILEGKPSELKVSRNYEGAVVIDGKINRARILTQDISACGGYLHIIDAVLSPVAYAELKQVT